MRQLLPFSDASQNPVCRHGDDPLACVSGGVHLEGVPHSHFDALSRAGNFSAQERETLRIPPAHRIPDVVKGASAAAGGASHLRSKKDVT